MSFPITPDSDFFKRAEAKLSEALDLVRRAMASGAAKDWEDYRRMCGEAAGLEKGLLILQDEYEKVTKR